MLGILFVLLVGSITASVLLYKDILKNEAKQQELHQKQLDLMKEITGCKDETQLETYVELVDANLTKIKTKVAKEMKRQTGGIKC